MGYSHQSKIHGQLQEIFTTHSTHTLILRWTQQHCSHQPWFQATGSDQIILSKRVKMHLTVTGKLLVWVEQCGLIHHTAELLKDLWQKLTKKPRKEPQLSVSYPHALILHGGGILSYTTKSGLLEADYASEVAAIRLRSQAQSL
jgi:hypothetical protein